MSVHNVQESVLLYFKEGSSDKVYSATLEDVNESYLVNFSYGRRGKPMKSGTKTPAPIPYEQAKRAYDNLVKEKMAKGYVLDENVAPFVGSVKGPERTNYLPQLLNPIELNDLPEALTRARGELALQLKHDGERRIVVVTQDEIYGSNRKGLRVQLPTDVVEALRTVIYGIPQQRLVLDTEDMGSHLVIFDVLEWDEDLTSKSFLQRAAYLNQLRGLDSSLAQFLYVDIPTFYRDMYDIVNFIQQAEAHNAEGVVLRDPAAPYTAGRPNSWGPCLKLKFYATATCIVESVHPTKSSIGLEMVDHTKGPGPRGQEQIHTVKVGNCTVPPNYTLPKVGDLVEIKYLYAYRGGALYQPQYKGIRQDVEITAANIGQLKFKE